MDPDEEYDADFHDETFDKDDDYNENSETANQTKSKRSRKQPQRKLVDTCTDEDTIKLIAEVETKDCIWDARTAEYKKRSVVKMLGELLRSISKAKCQSNN